MESLALTWYLRPMGSNLCILAYLPQNFLTVVEGEGEKAEGGGGKAHFFTFRIQTFQFTDIIRFTITTSQRSYYSSEKKKKETPPKKTTRLIFHGF